MSDDQTKQQAEKLAAVLQTKEDKKAMIADVVREKALAETEFTGLMSMAEGLRNGDELELKILTGSQTNFAYKVALAKDPTKAVFVKLSFEFAVWNPDRSQKFDLSRAVNEFEAIQRVAEQMYGGNYDKAPIAQPYYCVDVPPGEDGLGAGKLSITEWSIADVPLDWQFQQGQVDKRILTDIGATLARLNLLTPVQDEWNQDCRGCFRSLHPLFKQFFGQFVNVPDSKADVCIEYCKELGLERLETIIDIMDDEYMNVRQVLCHNDTKPSNILFKSERDDEAKWALVDWEMTIKGRNGKDAGIFQATTIAQAYCHAATGNKAAAHHLLDCIMDFWNAYEMSLRQGGKDDAYVLDALIGSFGSSMLYTTMGYYMMGIEVDKLPLDTADEATKTRALGSVGKTGIQLGEIAYMGKFNNLNLTQMKRFVTFLFDGEIDALLHFSETHTADSDGTTTLKQPRRPTVMVQQILAENRRASSTDKELLEFAHRRLSRMSENWDGRASAYDVAANGGSLLPPDVLKELEAADEEAEQAEAAS